MHGDSEHEEDDNDIDSAIENADQVNFKDHLRVGNDAMQRKIILK